MVWGEGTRGRGLKVMRQGPFGGGEGRWGWWGGRYSQCVHSISRLLAKTDRLNMSQADSRLYVLSELW